MITEQIWKCKIFCVTQSNNLQKCRCEDGKYNSINFENYVLALFRSNARVQFWAVTIFKVVQKSECLVSFEAQLQRCVHHLVPMLHFPASLQFR